MSRVTELEQDLTDHLTPEFVYEVQGYYGKQYEWEMVTREDTRAKALKRLREYDQNEPNTAHRIKRVKA